MLIPIRHVAALHLWVAPRRTVAAEQLKSNPEMHLPLHSPSHILALSNRDNCYGQSR